MTQLHTFGLLNDQALHLEVHQCRGRRFDLLVQLGFLRFGLLNIIPVLPEQPGTTLNVLEVSKFFVLVLGLTFNSALRSGLLRGIVE